MLGSRRILFAQAAQYFVESQLAEVEGQLTDEQFVEDGAERVDVAAGVDVVAGGAGLLRAHVARRAQHHADPGEHRFRVQALRDSFGYAEVDDAGHGLAVDFGDQDVGGLEVTVDDGFLVSVLYAFADFDEELQPLAHGKPVPVAVGRDGNTVDVFHGEIRAAFLGGAGVENFGDGGVVHQGECLAFRLEPRDYLAGIHAGLD